MLVVIRGAGDIATGIALRLWRAGIRVAMTDLEKPTAIRRTVAFSQAIVRGEAVVETVTAKRAEAPARRMKLPQVIFCITFRAGEKSCCQLMTPNRARS